MHQATQIEMPYGQERIVLSLPAGKTADVYLPNDLPAVADESAEIRRAMADPIAAPQLTTIARGKKTAAIVVDDGTRPIPTAAMLRAVVDELHEAGLRDEDMCVIIATGMHRAATDEEIAHITGGLPLKVISHDACDAASLVPIGTTAAGWKLSVSRAAVEADLRILTGDVELHQFVGYGGGAKSVMPGISDAASVQHTHVHMFSPGAGPGRFEGNPARAEVEESADLLRVDFMINVVLNGRHELVGAFAGDVHEAFAAGTQLVDRMYKIEAAHEYDVVIASGGGYPKDIDLYQSQKAVTSGRRLARRGGTVIVLAECREGHGSERGYEWAKQSSSPQDVIDRFTEFVIGRHKAVQLAREVLRADVHLYSAMPEDVTRAFFLKPVAHLDELQPLLAGADSIAALPQAISTLLVLPGQSEVDF